MYSYLRSNLVLFDMMNGHIDVDIPICLRPFVGSLLGNFVTDVGKSGFDWHTAPKDEGGHVTGWWLYVILDKRASAKSKLQFGETVHDAVPGRFWKPTPTIKHNTHWGAHDVATG